MSKHMKKVTQPLDLDPVDVTEDMIRQRAYELFEQRGYEHGHDWDDWLQAEAECIHKKATASTDKAQQLSKTTAA